MALKQRGMGFLAAVEEPAQTHLETALLRKRGEKPPVVPSTDQIRKEAEEPLTARDPGYKQAVQQFQEEQKRCIEDLQNQLDSFPGTLRRQAAAHPEWMFSHYFLQAADLLELAAQELASLSP